MDRRIGWAMLVAGVVFFGGLLSTHQKIEAQTKFTPVTELDKQNESETQPGSDEQAKEGEEPQEAQVGVDNTEVVAQLKEINTQLKELKELLCSGRVTVGVVQNPNEVKPAEEK